METTEQLKWIYLRNVSESNPVKIIMRDAILRIRQTGIDSDKEILAHNLMQLKQKFKCIKEINEQRSDNWTLLEDLNVHRWQDLFLILRKCFGFSLFVFLPSYDICQILFLVTLIFSNFNFLFDIYNFIITV